MGFPTLEYYFMLLCLHFCCCCRGCTVVLLRVSTFQMWLVFVTILSKSQNGHANQLASFRHKSPQVDTCVRESCCFCCSMKEMEGSSIQSKVTPQPLCGYTAFAFVESSRVSGFESVEIWDQFFQHFIYCTCIHTYIYIYIHTCVR